jgi:N utilization substance protein B
LLAEIPIAVTINECIEISRRFGSKDSSRFVNGVLDKLSREFDKDKKFVKVGRGLL